MATLFVVPTHSPPMAICRGGGAAAAQENIPQYNDDIGCNSHSYFFYGYLRRAAVAHEMFHNTPTATLFLILTHPSFTDICRESRNSRGA